VANTDAASEHLMMGLRLAEGIDTGRYERLAGASLDQAVIAELTSEGFLQSDGQRISATEKGRPVLNAVLRRLLV
jgi:oxygen-independent coproporphyrinogen-3 oxidase